MKPLGSLLVMSSVLAAGLLPQPSRLHAQVNVSGTKEFVRIAPQDVKWVREADGSFAPRETVALPAGGYMLHPAGEVHFDGAKDEEVIVQLVGYGPSSTTRLRPQDGNFGPSLGALALSRMMWTSRGLAHWRRTLGEP